MAPNMKLTTMKDKRKCSHLFYICYTELCKKQNMTPLSMVKNANNNSSKVILDITADRIKQEEWGPILNALCNDNSLHYVAIRCKQHAKKIYDLPDDDSKTNKSSITIRRSAILTSFVVSCLVDALTTLIIHTEVLAVLEIEGIPLATEYILMLSRGLIKNKTIQHLSLQYCLIGDEGCEILSRTLRHVSNISTLELTACNLTKEGISKITELLKFQKISRYSESWKQTLRYREPELDTMRGLRRITLNHNTLIGDESLEMIIEALQDDLWIKALDLQNCGITDTAAQKVLNLLKVNEVLEVVDLRRNPAICQTTLHTIMTEFSRKYPMDTAEKQFHWLSATSTTLTSAASRVSLMKTNRSKSETVTFKRSNTTFLLDKRRSSTGCTTGNRITKKESLQTDIWPLKQLAPNNEQLNLLEQLKVAKSKILETEDRLQEEKHERQRVDELNVQLHSQLMEAMSRIPSKDAAKSEPGNSSFVTIKKDVLKDIYDSFMELIRVFPAIQLNGLSSKGNTLCNKLQTIIEDVPWNKNDDANESIVKKCSNEIKKKLDRSFSENNNANQPPTPVPKSSGVLKKPIHKQKILPQSNKSKFTHAQNLFNNFLLNEDDSDDERNSDDDDNDEMQLN